MTDTTAPRTAAAELHDAIDALETVSVEWAPAHSAPYVSKYEVLPIADIYARRIEREAIEPLLALVRALTTIPGVNLAPGPTVVPDDIFGHYLPSAAIDSLIAALPESVRVAARKPE